MPADQARKLRSKLMIVMMIDDVLDKRKQNTQRNSTKHLLTEDKLMKWLDEKISILPKEDTNLTG